MKPSPFRMKFITNEPVQIKFLATLLVSMLAPLMIVGTCLYLLMLNVMADQLGIPEYITYNLVPVMKKINFIIMVGLPPLILLLFVWGVMLSHRFAGPLQRLKREIDSISRSGDYARRLKVRKHDDLLPLTDAINRLLERIQGEKK